jgi:hypothetical protein
MSEYVLEDAAANISSVVYDWLEAEVRTSSKPADVNAVLDDYTKAIAGLRGGFDHPYNFVWNKLNSHISRLEGWVSDLGTETSPKDIDFDKFAVKVTFGGLMQVSGSYRGQCYVEARGVEDYLERRARVINVNLTEVVMNTLTRRLPENGQFAEASIDLEELDHRRETVSNLGERAVKVMCNRVVMGQDLGQPGSRSAQEMMDAQRLWLDLTVDSIVLTAKLKSGDLGAVPFWEPISIGEQTGSLYYPLREPVDWAEVMSTNPRQI